MRKRLLIGVTALALTACGGGGGGGGNVQSGPRPLDPVQNQVQALSEEQRNGVLIRAIRDAGQQCRHVESSTAQPAAADGSPVYLARCAGGPAYVIGIGRGGNASVGAAGGQ